MPALTTPDRRNFETLCRAHHNGDLCLSAATDARTGEPATLICACSRDAATGDYVLTPLARMFPANTDPYAAFIPPDPTSAPSKENDRC
jgi:hypothetical protein